MLYHSPYKTFDSGQTINEIKKCSDIVIYGTGNLGALALHAFKKIGIKVTCYCDDNRNNWGKYYEECKIISPDQLKSKYPYAAIVIASMQFNIVEEQVKKLGFSRVYNCDFLFMSVDLAGIKPMDGKRQELGITWPINKLMNTLDLYMYSIAAQQEPHLLRIKTLDVVTSERCSLKCQDCAHLMQYYAKPVNCDTDQILASLDAFMDNIDDLHEARVIGGEPFMNKDLPSVIEKLSSYDNCYNIAILTNGTILPKEEVAKRFSELKVTFVISNYGEGISKKASSLVELLEKMQIPFVQEIYDTWQDVGGFNRDDRSEEELRHIFGSCGVNDALTLLHGKLYPCPFSAHAENLKAIPISPNESIELVEEQPENLREKIKSLISEKEYIQACKSCKGRRYTAGIIPAALQIRKPLPYKAVS